MEDKETSSETELIIIVLAFIMVFCGGFFLANTVRSRDDSTTIKIASCKIINKSTGTEKCKLKQKDGNTITCTSNKSKNMNCKTQSTINKKTTNKN